MTEARDEELQQWVDLYDAKLQTFKDLRGEVENELRSAVTVVDPDEDAGTSTQLFKVHDLRSRVKKRQSFRDKILLKRYSDPFDQMRDIVGARVVCLFLDDLPSIDEIIRDKFDVKRWEDKTKEAGPDRFGYRAIHYDCQIKTSYSGPRYDSIKGIWFEIQLRTILQDAWAVVEHTLGYKGPHSIPLESQADFSALVGLFHLADKSFQQLRDAATQQDTDARSAVAAVTASGSITVSPTPASADVGINRSTLKALLRHLYEEREASDDSDYSEFVEELASIGITRISRLRSLLAEGHDEALNSEAENPPVDEWDSESRYTDVGFARQAMESVSPDYRTPVSDLWADDEEDDDQTFS